MKIKTLHYNVDDKNACTTHCPYKGDYMVGSLICTECEHCQFRDNVNCYIECNYENKEHDNVNNPVHYTSHPSGHECIEITRHHTFNIGNAIKYLWRQGLKDGNSSTQDLEKAIWYIKDEINKSKYEKKD